MIGSADAHQHLLLVYIITSKQGRQLLKHIQVLACQHLDVRKINVVAMFWAIK
jgi:hypothetical protein